MVSVLDFLFCDASMTLCHKGYVWLILTMYVVGYLIYTIPSMKEQKEVLYRYLEAND